MRVLHTGDWHLGKNLEGRSRMDEQQSFLDDFVNLVKEKEVDLIIIAGDIYDTANPPARAEKMFYDTLKKLSEEGERLILVVAGNHDSPERLVAAGPLAMEHGIIMVGTPKTIIQPGEYGKHLVIQSGEGFVEIQIRDEKAMILTVPYPSEKRLNEVLYGEMDTDEERLKTYSERMHTLFNQLQANYREDTINLAVTHLFAMGSEAGGSENGIQLGGSYIVDGSCLPLEAQYIALGHIHKPQIVPGTNKKARYSGSPIHYNKKEIAFAKKCLLVEVEVGGPCHVYELPIKVYKPIEVWQCSSVEDAIIKCEENKDRECWVYLEIKTNQYIREDQIKQMKDLKKDILEINPILLGEEEEEVLQANLLEKSFEEVFKAFYKKERHVEPDDEVVTLLLSIMEGEPSDEAH